MAVWSDLSWLDNNPMIIGRDDKALYIMYYELYELVT